jgi:hypothetical protein
MEANPHVEGHTRKAMQEEIITSELEKYNDILETARLNLSAQQPLLKLAVVNRYPCVVSLCLLHT